MRLKQLITPIQKHTSHAHL